MIKRRTPENAAYPDIAAMPGTCAVQAQCATCIHYIKAFDTRTGRCWLAAKMRGLAYRFTAHFQAAHPREWWRGIKVISGSTAACKYWRAA